jgi:hypothetical protein
MRFSCTFISRPLAPSVLSRRRHALASGFTTLESAVVLVILVLFGLIFVGIGKRWLKEGSFPNAEFQTPKAATVLKDESEAPVSSLSAPPKR